MILICAVLIDVELLVVLWVPPWFDTMQKSFKTNNRLFEQYQKRFIFMKKKN